jgi:hypothetical protein
MTQTDKQELFDDLIWGVDAIAKEIKRSKRQAQHLIDTGVIEVVKLNPKTIVASRTKLNQRFAALSAQRQNDPKPSIATRARVARAKAANHDIA